MIKKNASFTEEQLQEAIKCRKEPIPDGIPPDVIKDIAPKMIVAALKCSF